MPKFIPPQCSENTKSNAEKKMFEKFKELAMPEAVILHSLGLPEHNRKLFGEVDFVLVCKRGIICFEVKGGGVACEQGQWLFTDRYGETHRRESPFMQAVGNSASLHRLLEKSFAQNPRLANIHTVNALMFPDIAFTAKSAEVIPQIVYDVTTKDITQYVNAVFEYWEQRNTYSKINKALTEREISEVVNFLRGDFANVPILRDSLNMLEKEIVRLTEEQKKVLSGLYGNDRLLISGRAGTGKTLLAVDFAKYNLEQGKKVLYLTFNKNLVQSVKNHFSEEDNIKIINIHALFGEYVPVQPENVQENARVFFNEIFPQKFSEHLLALPDTEREALQFDVLIMDEGQDILNPRYLESMDMLLKNGFDKGQWAVFYDDKQNIYNKDFAYGFELIKSYGHTVYQLSTNCRNTANIGQYCAKVGDVQFKGYLQEQGEAVQEIAYADTAEFKEKLQALMTHLQNEGVVKQEIVFLSPKKYASSVLSEIKFGVNEIGEYFDAKSKLPRYATIQGFKGLDAKIVILIDTHKIFPNNFAQFMYLASSRARTLLYLFGMEKFWERFRIGHK